MLNKKILDDNDPVPNIANILDTLGKAKYFAVFYLAAGYHQTSIKKEDRPKTAFQCDLDLFYFKQSPFGLKRSAGVFLSCIVLVIAGVKNVVAFFDDIYVFSTNFKEHCKSIAKLMERRKADLSLQP